MTLETPRLLLRPARPEDARFYFELWNSPFALRYNCMRPPSLEKAQARVAADAADVRVFYLERKADRATLGSVSLGEDELRYQADSLSLDYALAEPYANQGYMTEALERVIRHAFEDLGLELLSARVFAPNVASRRVLEKLGFTHEGTLRHAVMAQSGVIYDDTLYSLLREEYRARKA